MEIDILLDESVEMEKTPLKKIQQHLENVTTNRGIAADGSQGCVIHKELALLEKRLERVKKWGGDFGQIEFSPDIKLIRMPVNLDQARIGLPA